MSTGYDIPVVKRTATPDHLIWYAGELGGGVWEGHWIEFLLTGTVGGLGPKRNVLVINSFDDWPAIVDRIPDPEAWGLAVVDERNVIGPEVFRSFRFVLRVGFAIGEYAENVITVPLYTPGPFLAGEPFAMDMGNRQYVWCFCGEDSKQDRRYMLYKLRSLQPNFVHSFTGRWMPPEALSVEDYACILRSSIFAPSPFGSVHPECYRTYEALHCGALPIVKTDYYRQQFGAPLPVVRTWTEARDLMKNLTEDGALLADLRTSCINWYRSLPTIFRRHVAALVSR